ncbi:hypothetical protein GH5_06172 [Leishmania sp. Ghana 2012 LV757]|uniref:hypothetical protein n=1 Tax=Leishmania sp. Ghana 2012 LV757 TaxID=2803181 RepID=UPI001B608843|nr:hypothetical protein GH5_06172 [Leishmania sp. Ghana 2012 LV757]
MQRRLCSVSGSRMQTSLFGRIGGAALCQQRPLQSTAAADSGPTAAATVNSSRPSEFRENVSVPSGTPLPTQQVYKSFHKGRGTTPMPKPYQQRKVRAHHTPAIASDASLPATAGAAAAPSPLVGARSSCAEDAGPVPQRALSPLQKRQLQLRNKAAFVLTPQALQRVKYLLVQYSAAHSAAAATPPLASDAASEVPSGIRIGVRRRGCSGYSYTVNYYFNSAEASGKDTAPSHKMGGLLEDLTVEQDGVKVVVDADAQFYVIGTEMDYVVGSVEEKFTFKNPNQKYSCGCGESFMPFDADDMDDD